MEVGGGAALNLLIIINNYLYLNPNLFVVGGWSGAAIDVTLAPLLLQNGATLKCLTFQQLVCIGVIGQAV